MSQYFKYALTVVVTAAAMVAYQYEGKPEQVGLAQQAPSPVPEIKNKIAQIEQSISAEHFANAEVMAIQRAKLNFRERRLQNELAEHDKWAVQPYNPYRTICDTHEVVDENNDLVSTQVCEAVYDHIRHEYYSFSNEALEQLAYGDAMAAQVLGENLAKADPKKSVAMFIHAASISGKSAPLFWAVDGPLAWYSEFLETGEIPFDTVHRQLALFEVAKRMGDEFAQGAGRPVELEKVELDEALIKEIADSVIHSMVQTQLDVTGNSSLKEIFDV